MERLFSHLALDFRVFFGGKSRNSARHARLKRKQSGKNDNPHTLRSICPTVTNTSKASVAMTSRRSTQFIACRDSTCTRMVPFWFWEASHVHIGGNRWLPTCQIPVLVSERHRHAGASRGKRDIVASEIPSELVPKIPNLLLMITFKRKSGWNIDILERSTSVPSIQSITGPGLCLLLIHCAWPLIRTIP